MATPAALYYPHTKISDPDLIKNSLLLWDQVEYITPNGNWVHKRFKSKILNEAIDIIAVPHYPTNSERNEVHERVSKLVEGGLPRWFFLDAGKNIRNYRTYPIYANKLSSETWRMLEDHNLVRFEGSGVDYHASPYFGLMVMSLLGDACAGELKRKITDETQAYAYLQKFATTEAGGEYFTGSDVSQIAKTITRLVTVSIKVLNTDDIPISTLVAMRKREAKSSSHDYRNLRLMYLNKVDDYIQKIIKPRLREADIKELERQFEKDIESDLKDLKTELNINTRKALLSKEVLTSVVATAGSITLPVLGLNTLASVSGVLGIGALIKVGDEYKEAKRKILRGNSMSWLYLTNKRANQFDPKKVIF